MAISKLLALIGMALALVGTWLVAFELVSRFRGYAFEVKDITYRGGSTTDKTPDFRRWEARRAKYMWAGLVLITIGSVAQIASVLLTPN